MNEEKIEEARNILRDAGYFVDNLWHVDDVKLDHEYLDDDEAQYILESALTNDATMEQIWFAIDMARNIRNEE